jgi:uncharacterized protein YbdZ (MbtH family)
MTLWQTYALGVLSVIAPVFAVLEDTEGRYSCWASFCGLPRSMTTAAIPVKRRQAFHLLIQNRTHQLRDRRRQRRPRLCVFV